MNLTSDPIDPDRLRFHPLTELFPLMDGKDLEELAQDILRNGQREPIRVLPGGLVIDGRNRLRACRIAGCPPVTAPHDGPQDDRSLLRFVISLNLERRHLSESQRAMIAARIANRPEGRPWPEGQPWKVTGQDCPVISKTSKAEHIDPLSLKEAADRLHVSRRTVVGAKVVLRDGIPALREAVERGQVSVNAAEQIARLAPTVQAEALAAQSPAKMIVRRQACRVCRNCRVEPIATRDYVKGVVPLRRCRKEHFLPTEEYNLPAIALLRDGTCSCRDFELDEDEQDEQDRIVKLPRHNALRVLPAEMVEAIQKMIAESPDFHLPLYLYIPVEKNGAKQNGAKG